MGSYFSSAPQTTSRIPGRVVIVTGANRGVGLQTAKQLYELGATVYLGSRNEDSATEAIERIRSDVTGSDGELRWLQLDLSTVKGAQDSATRFLKHEDRLDVLVNNAVLGQGNFELNDDGVETMMAVNHIGHFAFTTALLDLMKKTSTMDGSDVRVVVVSSIVHGLPAWVNSSITFSEPSDLSKPFPPSNADSWTDQLVRYGRSKLANHLFTSELQRRMDQEDSEIMVVCVHPGNVTTNSALSAVGRMPVWGFISNLILKFSFVDEAEGARNSVFAATSPVVKAEPERYKGKYLMPIGQVTTPSRLARDAELAKQLWSLSESILISKGSN